MAQRTSDGKTDAGSVISLNLMLTGRQLFNLLDGAETYSMDYEDFRSEEEREIGRSLLQQAHDWGDISSDLEIGGKIDAAAALGEELNAAMEVGLMLYAAVTPQKMVLGGTPITLRTATVWLRRAENVAAEAG